MKFPKVTRDLVLLTVGLLLLINEAVNPAVRNDPRESLLVIYGGMMGLPAILRADELRRKDNGNGGGKEETRGGGRSKGGGRRDG